MHLADEIGVAILVAEVVLLVSKRSDRSRDAGQDRRSLGVIWITILLAVAAAYALRWNHVGPLFAIGRAGRFAAVAITAAGFAVRVWSVAKLGRFFTVDVAIREGHELIQSGPYSLVRHPSYTGLCAMFAGWAITFENYAAIAALLVPFSAVMFYRVRVEEAALGRAFGAAYETYRARTKRLFPFVY